MSFENTVYLDELSLPLSHWHSGLHHPSTLGGKRKKKLGKKNNRSDINEGKEGRKNYAQNSTDCALGGS